MLQVYYQGLEVWLTVSLFDNTKLRREEPGSGRSEYLKCARLVDTSRDPTSPNQEQQPYGAAQP